ncbi:hypothetical protein BJX61DRAFT_508053 [Aspergillus egyptiacus]|nr:hypothetical protein BJX61DRAFT_508053 [Aspergillus egyptiacus]
MAFKHSSHLMCVMNLPLFTPQLLLSMMGPLSKCCCRSSATCVCISGCTRDVSLSAILQKQILKRNTELRYGRSTLACSS